MDDSSLSVDLSRSRIRNSAVVGLVVYLVGFGVSFGAGSPRYPESIDRVTGAGAVFYNSHLVDLLGRRTIQGTEITIYNLIVSPSGTLLPQSPVPERAWLLVPVVLLLLGGAVVNAMDEQSVTPETAIITGSLMTMSYLPLMIGGALLIRFDDVYLYVPNLATATGVGGIMYPVVFGGLGGYIAHKVLSLPGDTVGESVGSSKVQYECRDCGNVFESDRSDGEVRCPDCGTISDPR